MVGWAAAFDKPGRSLSNSLAPLPWNLIATSPQVWGRVARFTPSLRLRDLGMARLAVEKLGEGSGYGRSQAWLLLCWDSFWLVWGRKAAVLFGASLGAP